MSPPLLQLINLGKDYSGKSALDNLSASIAHNSYVSLLGPSGSGKTTLLRLIAGFEKPDQGSILFNGEDIASIPPHARDIGFVFENFALFPHLSVTENVAFGLRNRQNSPVTDGGVVSRSVREMLNLVGLSGLGDRSVQQLSGGQRQRVALARTLVTEPKVVLLDEPLGALDANLRMRMRQELRITRDRIGVTFLHVTGSETEALAMGDTVFILNKGRIEQAGKPAEVFANPVTPAAASFLNCYNVIKGVFTGELFSSALGTFEPGQIHPIELPDDHYAVRHDHIRVLSAGENPQPGEEFLSAKFIAAEYHGASVHSFFAHDDGAVIEVETHLSHGRPPSLTADSSYQLAWKRSAAITFAQRGKIQPEIPS